MGRPECAESTISRAPFTPSADARRAYAAVGFTAEGVARGSAFFGGVHRDELVLAVLRPEWEARA